MEALHYNLPDKSVLGSSSTFLAMAKAYKIDSADMLEAAADDLKAIKTKYKELEAQRKDITGPMDKAKKAVMDLFRDPLAYLEEAEAIIKRAMLTYQREEDAKRREEEARLAEILRKEREQAAAEAAAAEADGDVEEVAALREHLAMTPMAAIVADAPKVSGLSTRDNWKGRVLDKSALIKAVAEGRAPEALLIIDEKVLNQMAKALKAELAVPGCEAYNDETVAVRVA